MTLGGTAHSPGFLVRLPGVWFPVRPCPLQLWWSRAIRGVFQYLYGVFRLIFIRAHSAQGNDIYPHGRTLRKQN